MAGNTDHFDARHDDRVRFQQCEFSSGLNGYVVLVKITGAVALGRLQRVIVLTFLNEVLRVRKRRHHFVFLDSRISAAVVKMQMRVDDDIDVARFQPIFAEAIR